MAIVNRDKDATEQKEFIPIALSAVTTTGGTYMICAVPFQCEVKAIRLAAAGLSTVPVFEVEAYRFSGGVTINSSICTATSVGLFGTSGLVSLTLGTAGSTQVFVDANSVLVLTVSGANAAAAQVSGTVVVQKLQDLVTYFGT